MSQAPTGTVTLVFTDIQGSTRLWEHDADMMQATLALHDEILRQLIETHNGYEVKTEGDAFMLAFARPKDAARWCLSAQEALHDAAWPKGLLACDDAVDAGGFRGVRVRMGIHTGDPTCTPDPNTGRMDYFGRMVNRAARVSGAGHGGQLLLSEATWAALGEDSLGVSIDLGEHRLKGLGGVERLTQLLPERLSTRRFPPLRTVNVRRTNLKASLTEMVGREQDLEQLQRAFDSGSRLVTLLGPGGTGKTRLATEFGLRSLDKFAEGGVWFCDLSHAKTAAGVLHTIATVLNIPVNRERDNAAIQNRLEQVLEGRGDLLLIADNLEQVIAEAAPILSSWLESVPSLHLLATSRELLRTGAEHVMTLDALSLEAGCALFAVRARSVRPSFEITAQNRADVEAIVTRLDGIPLAIELASARIRMLSPDRLLSRLSRRFDLLKGSRRDVDARQATLRGAIDWSWELLEDWERAALVQCAAFRGGFDIEAAEAVLSLEDWPDAPWPMDAVQSLCEKSLVRTHEEDDGEIRFSLFESIREYAEQKLTDDTAITLPDAGPVTGLDAAHALHERHAQHYANLGRFEHIERLNGPTGTTARSKMHRELDNLITAARRTTEPEAATLTGIAALELISRFGPLQTGLHLADHIRSFAGTGVTPFDIVRLKTLIGVLHYSVGEIDQAIALLESSRATALTLGRKAFAARLENRVGACLLRVGRTDEARERFQRAAVVLEAQQQWRDLTEAKANLALIASRTGEVESAAMYFQEAQAVCQRVQCMWSQAMQSVNHGVFLLRQGAHAEAQSTFQAAIKAGTQSANHRALVTAQGNLAASLLETGELEKAKESLLFAINGARKSGEPRIAAYFYSLLLRAHRESGDNVDTAEILDRALTIARKANDHFVLMHVLCEAAQFHANEGNTHAAAQAMDEAQTLADAQGISDASLTASLEKVKASLAATAADNSAR